MLKIINIDIDNLFIKKPLLVKFKNEKVETRAKEEQDQLKPSKLTIIAEERINNNN